VGDVVGIGRCVFVFCVGGVEIGFAGGRLKPAYPGEEPAYPGEEPAEAGVPRGGPAEAGVPEKTGALRGRLEAGPTEEGSPGGALGRGQWPVAIAESPQRVEQRVLGRHALERIATLVRMGHRGAGHPGG